MKRFAAMIVEDDPAIRELAARALERWDISVILPDPGEDIAALYARERPEVVVLDVGLPRLDGYE